ncbi:helix-turn-helix domain-containing protein [Globicatella sanguinis]
MKAGKRLMAQRKKLKLTRVQLAKMVNLSQESIYKYERDERIPTDENKIKLAKALDTTVSELFFRNK